MEKRDSWKERLKERLWPLIPLLQLYPLALGAVALCSPVAIVFYNMKKLGVFWLPILLSYTLLLSVAGWQLHRYQEMKEERFIYGDDELFFKMYPEFRRIEEAQKRCRALLSKLRSAVINVIKKKEQTN